MVWYPAAPGAVHLGMPTVFTSCDWIRDHHDNGEFDLTVGTVGEDPDSPRTFNGRQPIPELGGPGGHVCGTEADWLGESPFNEHAPSAELDEDGIPRCCERPIAIQGGAESGGEAEFTGIVPSPTCVGAPLLNYNQEYQFVGQTGFVRWEIPENGLVHWIVTATAPGAGTELYVNDPPLSCEFGGTIASPTLTIGTRCSEFASAGAPRRLYTKFNSVDSTVVVTLKIAPGPC